MLQIFATAGFTYDSHLEPDNSSQQSAHTRLNQRFPEGTSKNSNPTQVCHHNSLISMAVIFCETQGSEFLEVPPSDSSHFFLVMAGYGHGNNQLNNPNYSGRPLTVARRVSILATFGFTSQKRPTYSSKSSSNLRPQSLPVSTTNSAMIPCRWVW